MHLWYFLHSQVNLLHHQRLKDLQILTWNQNLLDHPLTRESPIKDLSTGCKWAGVSRSGFKSKMFDRIAKAHLLALKRAEIEVAMLQCQEGLQEASVAEIPKQPAARERALHETTHIPYRPWCQHCVATRSYGDHHAGVADPEHAAQRERRTIQADFIFCEERGGDTRYVLLMVDMWARYVHVEPGKVRNKRSVGDALSRFLGLLGYSDVELVGDDELVLVGGLEFCKEVRLRMGLATMVTTNTNYDKSRTSAAERMIQTIRNLQKTLIRKPRFVARFQLDIACGIGQ